MRSIFRIRTIISLFTLATVIYAFRTKQSHGKFLFVPFEFRVPTIQRVRERLWNPDNDSLFTPHVFGVGWSLNLYQVLKRLGVVGKQAEDSPQVGGSEG